MYILFGSKQKALKRTIPFTKACFDCEKSSQTIIGAVKYFHLFFIPIFVYKKTAFFRCNHCKYTFEKTGKDAKIDDLFSFKRIWGYNFGLLVISAFILLTILAAMISPFI